MHARSHPGRTPRLVAAALLSFGWAMGAHAMSLAEAFEAARLHDPQYRAAEHELDAARQNLPIARAGLLPQVQLTASNAEVGGTREFPNSLNQDVKVRVDYASPQAALSLRSPIFNYEGISRYRQAEAAGRGAEATYRVRGLGLVDRVATAYIQALMARAALSVTDSELTAARAQAERAQQRLRRGEGTRTEEAQANASVELARTKQVDALDQLELAMTRLRRLTGRPIAWLQALPADFRPDSLAVDPLQSWLDLARDQSPLVEARRESVAAARAGVQRGLAGHMPRLDLVASLSRSRNESLSNLNQTSTLKSVGVQLSVPIFSGGAVTATVRQAEAERARAEQELRAEIENVELEIQRLHVAVANGATRVDAYRQLIAANETALLGVTRALDAGLATSADVLEAQARLFGSLRDAVQARYEYLVARVRLLVNAGQPMQQVIDQVDRLLSVKTETTPAGATAKP